MTDPDLQAAHEEAMRQLAIKFEGESHRILKQAIDEYDRAMHRALKVYAIVILALADRHRHPHQPRCRPAPLCPPNERRQA